MANNYMQFSTMFEAEKEVAGELYKRLLANSDLDPLSDDYDEDDSIWGIEFELEEGGVWLYSEEFGNIEALVKLVGKLQVDLDLEEPFSFSWAETCSKMRLDEFGGGAVTVHKGKSKWMDTYNLP